MTSAAQIQFFIGTILTDIDCWLFQHRLDAPENSTLAGKIVGLGSREPKSACEIIFYETGFLRSHNCRVNWM